MKVVELVTVAETDDVMGIVVRKMPRQKRSQEKFNAICVKRSKQCFQNWPVHLVSR